MAHNFNLRPPPNASFEERANWYARLGRPSLFVGLDLGKSRDFSALCVMERSGDAPDNYQFSCTYLHRWKLKTDYLAIVADTTRLMNTPELQSGPSQPTLALDATAIGIPVLELFRREKHNSKLVPIWITGGSNVSRESGITRVPKKDLVAVVQVYLQNKRLKIASQLPEAATLTRELQNFEMRITASANETFGAASEWREGNHDDLVLAAALALWSATNVQAWSTMPFRLV
jgi:hypothetical protein